MLQIQDRGVCAIVYIRLKMVATYICLQLKTTLMLTSGRSAEAYHVVECYKLVHASCVNKKKQ